MKSALKFLFLLPLVLRAGIFDWFESCSPKAEKAKEVLQAYEPEIERMLKENRVPGVAIGVIVDGHLIYAKGFGYRDMGKKLPVTKDTVFAIGSCTKAFTSFTMGTLVDEGLIHWDSPVIDALAEFRLWDQYATTNVTIRDLLTHRTGMPRHEFVWYNAKMSKEEMLKRIRYLQPSSEIRERYQYGNLMYFTTGLAMERLSGKSWEELVKERVLEPLGMKHTNFSIETTQKGKNFAKPYVEKHGKLKEIPFRNLSLIGPAGGINANIEDMMKWIQMLLDDGVYQGKTLISPTTLQEIQAPQVIVPGAPETKESLLYAYAMGWGVLSYRGHYFITHDGVSDGFTTTAGILPAEKLGIVVLSNKNMTSFSRYLSLEIIDRILGLPNANWLQNALDNLKKNQDREKQEEREESLLRKKGTHPSHPLEEYEGIYEHPGYGQLKIELVGGKLEANYNDLIFVLDHWHYDVFSVCEEKQDMVVSFEGAKFTFCNDARGDIGEVRVPFEPSADDIIFEKKAEEQLSTIRYLEKFKGVFEIYGYTVEVILQGNALLAVIPGQPRYELIPIGENEFTVKSMVGTTVRFIFDPNEKVKEVFLIHPYGAFSATPKNQV